MNKNSLPCELIVSPNEIKLEQNKKIGKEN